MVRIYATVIHSTCVQTPPIDTDFKYKGQHWDEHADAENDERTRQVLER